MSPTSYLAAPPRGKPVGAGFYAARPLGSRTFSAGLLLGDRLWESYAPGSRRRTPLPRHDRFPDGSALPQEGARHDEEPRQRHHRRAGRDLPEPREEIAAGGGDEADRHRERERAPQPAHEEESRGCRDGEECKYGQGAERPCGDRDGEAQRQEEEPVPEPGVVPEGSGRLRVE